MTAVSEPVAGAALSASRRLAAGQRPSPAPVRPPVVARTRSELTAALADLPGPRRLVPTMGALHAGHAALLTAAGPGSVLSIFVNPLQFGPHEDLARYPRTFAADLALAHRHEVAVVWAPSVEEMYAFGPPAVTVHAGPLGGVYEGAVRPGHFDGMLTVVAKLFGLVRPHLAYFGAKDAQQLALIRAMSRDLDLPVGIVEVATVREPDGLALSSRNRYLSEAQRHDALVLSGAVRSGSLARARRIVTGAPGIALDYLDLVDPLTFAPASGPDGRLIIAARVGDTRLIDNDLTRQQPLPQPLPLAEPWAVPVAAGPPVAPVVVDAG